MQMGNVLSLRDLLNNKYQYLQDKVFQLDLQENSDINV